MYVSGAAGAVGSAAAQIGEAEGAARDRERRARPRRSSGCARSGSRRSTTANTETVFVPGNRSSIPSVRSHSTFSATRRLRSPQPFSFAICAAALRPRPPHRRRTASRLPAPRRCRRGRPSCEPRCRARRARSTAARRPRRACAAAPPGRRRARASRASKHSVAFGETRRRSTRRRGRPRRRRSPADVVGSTYVRMPLMRLRMYGSTETKTFRTRPRLSPGSRSSTSAARSPTPVELPAAVPPARPHGS